jgi:hypothetical protein
MEINAQLFMLHREDAVEAFGHLVVSVGGCRPCMLHLGTANDALRASYLS